jgi:hypothetical protein
LLPPQLPDALGLEQILALVFNPERIILMQEIEPAQRLAKLQPDFVPGTLRMKASTVHRRHAVRILRAQPAEALSRTAVHNESGLLTLRQPVLKAVRHLRHNLPFIAEKRTSVQAGQPYAQEGTMR